MESNGDTRRDGSTSPYGSISASVLKDAFRYLYVVAWVYTYWIRTTVVGVVIRWVIVILSFVELIGPWSDWYSPRQSSWRLGLAVTLFAVAIALSINHQRLTVRLLRHDVILSSIRVLLEQGTLDDRSGVLPLDRVANVLDALARSIEYGRRSIKMNATLVLRSNTDGKFRVATQDSRRIFSTELSLDGINSTAGMVAAGRSEVVIYVPNTRFRHGVQIDLLREFPKREYFRATKIVSGAFQFLDAKNQLLVRSLVCINVPVGTQDAVLCVSGQSTNTLGYLELSAIKVAAGLIAQVFKTTRVE